MIEKKTTVATEVIKETVELFFLEGKLNDVEKKFIGLHYNSAKLSLTENQSVNYQLRFFGREYAYAIINNIAVKIKTKIAAERKIEFNLYKYSELELFFVERLCELTNNIILSYKKNNNIKSVVSDFENFLYFLNKGDNVTSDIIWHNLIESKLDDTQKLSFYHTSGLMFKSLKRTLASETMLKMVIENDYIDKEHIAIKVKAMYILAMNYLRNNYSELRSITKAKILLDSAYKIADNELAYLGKQQQFIKIFNRNGYALAMFQEKRVAECIKLLQEILFQISQIVNDSLECENKHYQLHKVVIMYNLYQCYLKRGSLREAENILIQLIELDSNDVEYRYNYLISLEACLDRQTLHAIQHKYNDQNDSDYQTEIEGIFNENKTKDTH